MVVYVRGVVVAVGAPTRYKEGGVLIQQRVIQHELNTEPKYNRWIAFDVYGDNIEKLAFRMNEEVEVALDITSKPGSNNRYYNTVRAFGVERNKDMFHKYEKKRVAAPAQPFTATGTGQPYTPQDVGTSVAGMAGA